MNPVDFFNYGNLISGIMCRSSYEEDLFQRYNSRIVNNEMFDLCYNETYKTSPEKSGAIFEEDLEKLINFAASVLKTSHLAPSIW